MIPSILIIVSHIFVLHLIRQSLRSSSSLSDSTKDFLIAGLGAFELGCTALEQGVLMERAGLAIWAVSLFLVVVWHILGWGGHSPNAIPHMLKGSGHGLACALIMLFGSLLSYRHMSNVWAIELVSQHKNRAQAIASGVCSIPWSKTHLFKVVVCEFAGTFLLCLLPPLILENQSLANNDSTKLVRAMLVAATVSTTVIAGMKTSGAMYNPTLASLLVGGCKEYSMLQHLVVYWVAPLIGALLGTSVYYKITRPTEPLKKKIK